MKPPDKPTDAEMKKVGAWRNYKDRKRLFASLAEQANPLEEVLWRGILVDKDWSNENLVHIIKIMYERLSKASSLECLIPL